MQVLVPGVIPEKEKPIWVGMRIRCPKCRALIEFDENDRLGTRRQYGINGPTVYDCPTKDCNTEIWFKLPHVAEHPVKRTSAERVENEPIERWPNPKPIITCDNSEAVRSLGGSYEGKEGVVRSKTKLLSTDELVAKTNSYMKGYEDKDDGF